ncbi:MAG: molybdate ABC transporter substrate-binding protein [Hyphomicrobium sp.]|nr:molybdate ABC transporter substrate-binding protein [Hyphomicrobium sp.]
MQTSVEREARRSVWPRLLGQWLALSIFAIGVFGLAATQSAAQKTAIGDVTVFAAASLKNALDAVAADYLQRTGSKVSMSYAGSSALAKQIELSAPADIFISADQDWMDYLAKKNLIKADTRINLLGNALVLVAPATSKIELKIAKDFDLTGALGEGRLAMADVNAVPAGKYGKAALETLGAWSAVETKTAQAENVRAALALVARGEAPLGIVYRSDAISEPKVKIVDTFPDETHAPIVYPGAVTAAAKNVGAASAFITFLKSPEALARFSHEGFSLLK